MAKKATSRSGSSKGAKRSSKKTGTSLARVSSRRANSGSGDKFDASDAFIKLLQSPLVAELVAVAATAALAALAEQGFSNASSRGKRAGHAVKAAGKAAAAAVGRRLGTEMDEIRKAAKASSKA